jgi:hypothetical protein
VAAVYVRAVRHSRFADDSFGTKKIGGVRMSCLPVARLRYFLGRAFVAVLFLLYLFFAVAGVVTGSHVNHFSNHGGNV